MANELTLDSLDFDVGNSPQTNQEPPAEQNPSTDTKQEQNPEQHNEESQDAIADYLKTIGIEDPEKIKFEDDKGNVSEKAWKDLTEEEKLGILQTPNVKQVDPTLAANYGLDESESALINYLRQNNISPDEYAESLREQGAQENQPEQIYQVDNLSDDELYLSDLQLRTNNTMTNEELQHALENAKANPDSYNKIIQGLRNEYKILEDQQNQQKEAEIEANRQEQFNQFSNQILDSIDNFDSVGDLSVYMDNDEKNQLAEFILGNDGAGVNYLTKALNDPNALVAASWFLLHGQDMLSDIENYVGGEIKKAREAGKAEALKEFQEKTKQNPNVVVKTQSNNNPTNSNYQEIKSIDDINFYN